MTDNMTLDEIVTIDNDGDGAQESTALIKLVQLPVIEEQLRTVKERWELITQQTAALACTEDTLTDVKKSRAAMTKDFKALEAQRAEIKKAIMERYDAFNETYRTCITEPYQKADTALKGKIDDVESEIKSRCEERLRAYFDELCELENIDFIQYEQCGVKIDMVSAKQKTPKKLMEQIYSFVNRVSSETRAISKMQDAPEIMAEYKETLNMAAAVDRVTLRKKRVEAERQAQEEREAAEREAEERMRRVKEAATSAAPMIQTAAAVETAQQMPTTATKKAKIPERITFTIFPASAEQFEKIKPYLVALRDTMKKEGIRYE